MTFEEFCKATDNTGGVYLDTENSQVYLTGDLESVTDLPSLYVDEVKEALENPDYDGNLQNKKLEEIEKEISQDEDILQALYDDWKEGKGL